MKVQDLKRTKIGPSPGLGLPGETGLIADDCTMVSVWWIPGEGFESEAEAMKAAALFRAAYEMQQAIRRAVAWFEEGGAKGYPAHKGLLIALELSENTAESPNQ